VFLREICIFKIPLLGLGVVAQDDPPSARETQCSVLAVTQARGSAARRLKARRDRLRGDGNLKTAAPGPIAPESS
jgi:hypothetical protein